jgi:hypothetical protein
MFHETWFKSRGHGRGICPSFSTSARRSLNATYRFGKRKEGGSKEEGSDEKLRENQDTFKQLLRHVTLQLNVLAHSGSLEPLPY